MQVTCNAANTNLETIKMLQSSKDAKDVSVAAAFEKFKHQLKLHPFIQAFLFRQCKNL
jgi:hypothetical protein